MRVPSAAAGIFSLLSGYGFLVDAPQGISIRELLEGHLGIDADYIRDNIGTVLHNGKPVDDLDTGTLCETSTIALSAAMPGLFGAAFRKQGKFAAMRPRHREHNTKPDTGTGQKARSEKGAITIRLKLFNLTARELAPKLLQKGVRMQADHFRSFWRTCLRVKNPGDTPAVLLNGQHTAPDSLAESIRSQSVILFATTH